MATPVAILADGLAVGVPPRVAVLGRPPGLTIELLENGSVHAIRHGGLLVNQVLASPEGGGIGNVYLRRRTRAGMAFAPLLGPASRSAFRVDDREAAWAGTFGDLAYTCTLRLAPREPAWSWSLRVRNTGRRPVTVDAVLAQDLGIASEDAVRASEAYTSQYIDHTILVDPAFGVLVCSRQNLVQQGRHPWVMHGCLEGAVGYLTDGFQLYGLAHRATGVPAALGRRRLPNRRYQYEMALPTIQSRSLLLKPGETGERTFFAAFEADHPDATSDADVARARTTADGLRGRSTPSPSVAAPARAPVGPPDPAERAPDPAERAPGMFDRPLLFASADLLPDELERCFGGAWRHVERRDGTLLSFFHGRETHVVLRAKELLAERPTGLIMLSGRALLPSDDVLSVTAWMSGVFASQVAIGNTSFNKLLGIVRDPLGVLRSSGQRIFVKTRRGLELLGVPSAFEMGPTAARWIYQDDDHTIVVRVATSLDAPACRLTIDVERGGPLAFLVAHSVVLGANELDAPGTVAIDAARGRVELRPSAAGLIRSRYPDATFHLVVADPAAIDAIGGDGLLHADGVERGGPFVVVRSTPVRHLALGLTGSILDAGEAAANADALAAAFADDGAKPLGVEDGSLVAGLGRGARLGGGSGARRDDIARLDDVLPWYLHDAVIHLARPHGLEQASGAAWGLRDVCQGPAELLVACGQASPLRAVLRTVYEHQLRGSGDWPQWFMVDRFRDVQGPGSHADIIHWPIKALCDYIEATDDLTILDEQVAWTDEATLEPAGPTASIAAHVERQVERIEQDVIAGTSLPVFAGGDWEDTLQPADPAVARQLVSSWTVELAYQTLQRYRVVCERAGATAMAARLGRLCDRLRADFNEHLVPDGVVAGLARFGPDGIDYLLHPRDRRTGVRYRLLPMTRGIISGLFSPAQARTHAGLIERHLRFPDGVRLMDRPMAYRGGTSRIFIRAESAANFGREIGLQYVHAHLRYVEAMAMLGRGAAAFDGLMTVCPVGWDVPMAQPIQANAYFSSADAAFADRREASRRFEQLRAGRVGIKGGWRVYSSGPGIFLNQLIRNVLGLRTHYGDVVFDPVLPPDADGLTFDLGFEGRPVQYRFRVSAPGFAPRGVTVNGRAMPADRRLENPYRTGGLLVARHEFIDALQPGSNVVEILV